MGDDIEEDIGILLDPEIETPVTGHPCLPAFGIILLGAQRGMPNIVKQKSHLLEECPFDCRWCVGVGTIKVTGGALA
jgi:hypothetical protein